MYQSYSLKKQRPYCSLEKYGCKEVFLLSEPGIPLKRDLFQQPDPPHVDQRTHRIDGHNAHNGMNHDFAVVIRADIITDVPPQPTTHGITVGMNQKNSKRRCRNRIDCFTIPKFQTPEEEEQADPCDQCQNLVGIRYKEIAEPDPFPGHPAEPCQHHNTAPRKRQTGRRQPPCDPAVLKPLLRVQAKIGRNDIQDAEPSDIVERHLSLCKGRQHDIDTQSPCHQKKMFPLRQSMDQLVQKRNQQIEQQKAAYKVVAHRKEREQLLQEALNRKCLIAGQKEHSPKRNIIKVRFSQQFTEFLFCDVGGTHKVSRNHHKAVDSRLSAPTKQEQKVIFQL